MNKNSDFNDLNKEFNQLSKNLKRVKLTNCVGIASISWIKKNGLNKI